MRRDFDCIVIGLGGIGSAAAYWLSRRIGGDVLGLEQYPLGHTLGSSEDHSRIIRLSYHTPAYVRLARQAYEAWAALESDAGQPLIIRTGGLDFAPRQSAIPLSDYANSLAACGVPHEMLDAAEIMRRWPQFTLSDDIHGMYQAESGIAPAGLCNAAHRRMARQHGAVLVDNSPVTALRATGDEVEVLAGGEAYRCRKLVLACGAWSNNLLAHFGLRLPLTITQEQVTYFATPNLANFQPDRFPIWIWMDDPCFYGFPVYGEQATKAAQDVGGRELTAETRDFEPDQASHARLVNFLECRIPGALGPVLRTRTCLYDMPPDRDFVLDALPGQPNVFAGIGAGHAFKFASLFGRIFSELALDGESSSDLSPFKIDRPVMQMADPPKNFMMA